VTKGLLPPELEREVSKLKKRVSDLERVLGEVLAGGRDHGLPFTIAGPVYISESPPWTPRFATRAVEVIALLGAPAEVGTTTIEVRKNGNPIGAGLALGVGETVKRFTISSPFGADEDLLTVGVTAAGTGAEDLDVIVRFR